MAWDNRVLNHADPWEMHRYRERKGLGVFFFQHAVGDESSESHVTPSLKLFKTPRNNLTENANRVEHGGRTLQHEHRPHRISLHRERDVSRRIPELSHLDTSVARFHSGNSSLADPIGSRRASKVWKT